jgi:hypothetical protein
MHVNLILVHPEHTIVLVIPFGTLDFAQSGGQMFVLVPRDYRQQWYTFT